MAIYSFCTFDSTGLVTAVYILDGIEISASEYAAVQAAAFDRYYDAGYGGEAGA